MTRVGVVGGDSVDSALVDRVSETVERAAELESGTAAAVLSADPETVVAVGESALLELVREGVEAPVLPVAAGPGYGGVPGDEATAAVEDLLAGEFETDPRAVLRASVDGERVGRALADAMLVTTEPARISEYAVRSGDERVARFRADAVAVSTPTGSHGYGRSVGGPLLEPGSDVVGVVPVAPFAVDMDHWVLSTDEPVALTVERDEGEVSLLLDDRTVRPVPPNTPVEIGRDGTVDLAAVEATRPFFER